MPSGRSTCSDRTKFSPPTVSSTKSISFARSSNRSVLKSITSSAPRFRTKPASLPAAVEIT